MAASMNGVSTLTAAMREFSGTDCMRIVVKLLDAMKDSYMSDLVHVKADDLALKQGAVRQVMALRDAIVGEQMIVPLV